LSQIRWGSVIDHEACGARGEDDAKQPTKKDGMQQLEECTDEELMQEYQQCNEKAFEVLFQRHSGKVYGFLKKKLKDEAFVDDVFQATFMKLHHARSHYDPSFPFPPWLFTVCRSVLVDSIRKRERISEDLNELATLELGWMIRTIFRRRLVYGL